MRRVSKEYKNSMLSPLRGRGYIRVYMGVIKQDAQSNAELQPCEQSYISNTDGIFTNLSSDTNGYATLEQDYTTVAGSMRFPYPESYHFTHEKSGLISKHLVSEGGYIIQIKSKVPKFNFKGITLDFGENYAVDFEVTAGDDTLKVTGNIKQVYVSQFVFNNVVDGLVTIKIKKLRSPNSRARLYNFKYGFGLSLGNKEVTNSTLTSYISPIQENLPQIDFKVTADNKDKRFNVDDPNSVVNFIEYGQKLSVSYGYQPEKNGKIEWINKAELVCKNWKSDDKKAVLEAVDFLRDKTELFKGGAKIGQKNNVYKLLEDVLKYAKIDKYYIDRQLEKVTTTNPIPELPVKQALQLVANMAKAEMLFDYDLGLLFKCNFEPKATVVSNETCSDIARIENILNDGEREEFATYAPEYTVVAVNKLKFLDVSNKPTNTGYISKKTSNASGKFNDENDSYFIVNLDRPYSYQGVRFVFGECLPSEILIQTFKDDMNNKIESLTHKDINKHTNIIYSFREFNIMKVSFLGTQHGNNRIVLNKFSFGDVSDFKIRREDMLNTPLAERQELIKTINVPYYVPRQTKNDKSTVVYSSWYVHEKLKSEKYPTEKDGDFIITFRTNCEYYYDFEIELGDEKVVRAKPVPDRDFVKNWQEKGITFQVLSGGNSFMVAGNVFKILPPNERLHFSYRLKAKKMSLDETENKIEVNPRGKEIKWKNPLISDKETADNVGNWLKEYYLSGIEYEYKTRGNPELDVNDIVYQENEWDERMQVNVYKTELIFDGAFKQKLWTRFIRKDIESK